MTMLVPTKILSDITVFMKYSKYNHRLGRRETWKELVDRNKEMHHKMYPEVAQLIDWAYDFVYDKKVLPSMRSLQFAGKPIEISPNRIYNCAYLPITDSFSFGEVMFSLLSGTGIGYSVQHRHVRKLPPIVGPNPLGEERRYLVSDNIEGWADCVYFLIHSYLHGGPRWRFDFRDIREKGSQLITSGGKAPGPEPLAACISKIETLLIQNQGQSLTPLMCHDILCYIADAVLAGGIRRAAMISLFDLLDMDMLTCKHGDWWVDNPQRGRANNSAVLHREHTTRKEFDILWDLIRDSNSGEPGIFWTNDYDVGANPCCEISLKPYQMCNLTEIIASDIKDQDDLNMRAVAAAYLGTLQAGYTDFHYLRPEWKKQCEEDALLGVGITGIAGGELDNLDVDEAAEVVCEANEFMANKLGINKASRVTTIKPSGTSSLVAGTSSGIHAWHDKYYIRRLRVHKNEPIYKYLINTNPELIVTNELNPEEAIIEIPQKAPEHATTREESVFDLLDRVKKYNNLWVKKGHRKGVNNNNVSCTISVKEDDWDDVKEWMWSNRKEYNGISVLPFDGGSYIQAPFESISKDEYESRVQSLTNIDLSDVFEYEDNTSHVGEIACSLGGCEI